MPDPTARQMLERRKKRHAALNDFIGARGGWLVSISGDPLMGFEAPIGSTLPQELVAKGYIITSAGSAMRIDPIRPATLIQPEVFTLELPLGALP
jgi:hypothetical protein